MKRKELNHALEVCATGQPDTPVSKPRQSYAVLAGSTIDLTADLGYWRLPQRISDLE
jgi:hypothetical protein